MLPGAGRLLLELGAGAGRNTPRYQGFDRIVLLDYSLSQLQQAQSRLGRDDRYVYVAADIYHLPFTTGLFDTATMIRTLHHMADVSLALSQVRRVIQPGGIFVLEFASKRNLKAIFRYWLKRQPWNPFSLEPIEFVALNFDFHPRYVFSNLEENHFKIQRKLSVSHFRIPIVKKVFPTQWLVAMDAFAQLTGNWWQLTPSVFVRSEADNTGHTAKVGAFFNCPVCGGPVLDEAGSETVCENCSLRWSIKDGIYDFRHPISK